METREFEVRLAPEEERTVTGIAVPWDTPRDVGGYREMWKRGSVTLPEGGMKLLWQHKEPIGVVTRTADTDEGFVIEARISDTPRGNEVHTLLRDGVLNKFSIGFQPVEDSVEDGVVVRTKAVGWETSVVMFPAFDTASVLAVREADTDDKEINMENTSTDVSDLREQVADLDRRMAVITDLAPSGDVAPQFRSFGQFVHAVVTGNEDAIEMTRAFGNSVAGATAAAPDPIVNNAWVSDVVRLVDLGRPTLNAFRRDPLPPEGMNVEWPEVKANTIDVAKQAAEADYLKFGKLTLEGKTSPVETFGGYTAMSRQAIERSSFNYLDTAFRAMAIAYAKQSNAKVAADLIAGTGYGTATAANTAKGWIDALTDAAISIYTGTGLAPEFILCASDVYKKIVGLMDATGGRPVVAAGNPSNNVGTANIPALNANLLGVPVILDVALTAGTVFIANREGLVTYESGGAPFRLSNEDNMNLTKEFSVYGYIAVGIPMPKAIVKVTAS
jgi:uncharacterized protein